MQSPLGRAVSKNGADEVITATSERVISPTSSRVTLDSHGINGHRSPRTLGIAIRNVSPAILA
ncbi:MAG: hypothetical protein ACE5OY_06140 [Candidatus Bathyarchaeia archaeon]